MRNLFRNMPWTIEFAIVVAGAFGLSIVHSIILAFHPPSGAIQSEPALWHMIGRQLVVLVILGGFLRLRGWNLERLGLQSHWMDGLHGVALAAAAYFTFYLALLALTKFLPHLAEQAAKMEVMPKVLSPWIVAAVVLVNSFYEEVFVSGYIITALKERAGESIAINVSVAVRLSYHLYQGVVGVLGMVPVGLIFAYWYARTGRLWPLMVAHGAINLVGMLQYVKF